MRQPGKKGGKSGERLGEERERGEGRGEAGAALLLARGHPCHALRSKPPAAAKPKAAAACRRAQPPTARACVAAEAGVQQLGRSAPGAKRQAQPRRDTMALVIDWVVPLPPTSGVREALSPDWYTSSTAASSLRWGALCVCWVCCVWVCLGSARVGARLETGRH